MRYVIIPFSLLLILLILCQCSPSEIKNVNGVSVELAKYRKAHIDNLSYSLHFTIPKLKSDPVMGIVEIKFSLTKSISIPIDYMNDSSSILSIIVNGREFDCLYENEHIIIPAKALKSGDNVVMIRFRASDQSLNRRDEFLYSLLVPDRARSLFPCFDQPNMKAIFSASLDVPLEWTAVSNGKVTNTRILGDRKQIDFSPTEPLSTYLFSIVAGKFDSITQERNGRSITMFHRENDSQKLSQCDEIFRQVFASLDFMEEYTSINYPFAKYDLIILPGFQYGGMEHTGATLYADRTMFLPPNPTINEQLSRSNLIAHETAHMWFGDYVTMDWFNDVWTKEVFANYFASLIIATDYPKVNQELSFLLSNIPPAYWEDRTSGTNPIQQNLDNLNHAGLVYGNIIYKKSPVVMKMLVEMVGKSTFRKAIREYLTTYAYSNATWDDLIAILDKYSDHDLQSWSDAWVKKSGMPRVQITSDSIIQRDPLDRGVIWTQPFSFIALHGNIRDTSHLLINQRSIPSHIIAEVYLPNMDGLGYGYFVMDSVSTRYSADSLLTFDELTRGSLLINLYENLLNKNMDSNLYADAIMSYLPNEKNNLLFSLALGNLVYCNQYIERVNGLENLLWGLYEVGDSRSIVALRSLFEVAESEDTVSRLYRMWNENKLSENDAISLSYQLALRMENKADEITAVQISRITNVDRQEQYRFIAPSISPRVEVRDSVFNALLSKENRRIEPWAQTALALLNHRLRQKESLKYIQRGLEEMREIQQTGDIFFPGAWCSALLSGHDSEEARTIVKRFIDGNPDYPTKLMSKIKQRIYHLGL
ncbi:MAG: M1 family metallopeptidase [Bacteroidales bacterium]